MLHSHVQKYPEGSKQQQVTAYTHHDANNMWIIAKINRAETYPDLEYLKDGDQIVLRHDQTKVNLHSHYIEGVSISFHFISSFRHFVS
jgi:dolichyl-phosphate-mannose-protein mannosyltransferase